MGARAGVRAHCCEGGDLGILIKEVDEPLFAPHRRAEASEVWVLLKVMHDGELEHIDQHGKRTAVREKVIQHRVERALAQEEEVGRAEEEALQQPRHEVQRRRQGEPMEHLQGVWGAREGSSGEVSLDASGRESRSSFTCNLLVAELGSTRCRACWEVEIARRKTNGRPFPLSKPRPLLLHTEMRSARTRGLKASTSRMRTTSA